MLRLNFGKIGISHSNPTTRPPPNLTPFSPLLTKPNAASELKNHQADSTNKASDFRRKSYKSLMNKLDSRLSELKTMFKIDKHAKHVKA